MSLPRRCFRFAFLVLLLSACAEVQGTETHKVGAGDSLLAIAIEYCGTGEAVSSIFEANRGVLQANGASMTDPDNIEVGWEITIDCGSNPDLAVDVQESEKRADQLEAQGQAARQRVEEVAALQRANELRAQEKAAIAKGEKQRADELAKQRAAEEPAPEYSGNFPRPLAEKKSEAPSPKGDGGGIQAHQEPLSATSKIESAGGAENWPKVISIVNDSSVQELEINSWYYFALALLHEYESSLEVRGYVNYNYIQTGGHGGSPKLRQMVLEQLDEINS